MKRQETIEAAVNELLSDRGSQYGDYDVLADTAQKTKEFWRATPNWNKLSSPQQESLDMIATKISRVLNGDPNNTDTWYDMAGYAVLVVKILKGQNVVQLPADCE